MTKRNDVSVLQNRWHDSQRVDEADMETEQNRNNQIDAAIINNHFGSGVLLQTPEQTVLFDSDDLTASQAAILAAGNFDGTGISVHTQPSDSNLGNQLEVELTDSSVFGRFSVKVVIIGLSFDDTIQMDRFYFYKNEKQVTSKHYKEILSVFFNDFKGNQNCSRSLGGRVVIREAAPFQISRDPLMAAQDVEPDLFWRDFKVGNLDLSLFETIQDGIGDEFSADGLSINTTGRPNRTLTYNDVTSQVGQKFIATTDNIQKVTLLLGVSKDDEADVENWYDWTGDLVISIYPLQTSVSCPTDIIPSIAIDFDPSSQPLAQLSFSQSTLEDVGYVLTDTLQPIDFVFSATKIGSGATSQITPGKFYAITVKRSGASTSGNIFVGCGNDRLDDARVTLFSGVWVDVPEEDLWFQVWTDAAKIADGSAYDAGNGMQYEKTTTDDETGATIDNLNGNYSFTDTGQNVLNIGVVQAITEETITIQNERTGNDVFSRQKFVPSFSFVTSSGLADLKSVSDPLVIGCLQDTNPKQNAELLKTQSHPGMGKDDTFCIVNPDADLLSLNLLGSKLIPNTSSQNNYRIFQVTSCIDGYGDVNGDGIIDSSDIVLATSLIGESIYSTTSQQKIKDGYFTTLELLRADVNGDGYVTVEDINLITSYVNKETNSFPAGSTFKHLCLKVQQSIGRFDGYYDCLDGYIRLDGYSGLNIISASSLSDAELIYDGYLTTPTIQTDPAYSVVPYVAVNYRIIPQPYWQPHQIITSSKTRYVPVAFTEDEAIVDNDCDFASPFVCVDNNEVVLASDPGRNDFYIPDHLIIGKGEIKRPDGSNYKVDLEVATIILQLPAVAIEEKSVNIFEKFIADRGDGLTRGGWVAAKYSDCSTVQDTDLALNRVRFGVSVQSYYPSIDGYSVADGYGVNVDPIIGVYINPTTGILTITMRDLDVDSVYSTLVTKIQIEVFLKKAGWNNTVLNITSSEVQGLLGL